MRQQLYRKTLPSYCIANQLAIKSIMLSRLSDNAPVLFEATSNQVNHKGGYTGMTPFKYKEMVVKLAEEVSFPVDRLIFGGDHLGPLPFSHCERKLAEHEAELMVRSFIKAGFQKLHIDTSMPLGSEKFISKEAVAKLGVKLIKVAEQEFSQLKEENPLALEPIYVIGSEVPPAGGKKLTDGGPHITSLTDIDETLKAYQEEIQKNNLMNVWDRIVALVIQPGVEYGDSSIDRFNESKFPSIADILKKYDIALEAHSTDYQNIKQLKGLVNSGFLYLKVGPEVTKSLLEALLKLEEIESLLIPCQRSRSNLRNTLLRAMRMNPRNWERYYSSDTDSELLFSLLDRSRYYLGYKEVEEAIKLLLLNLKEGQKLPVSGGIIRYFFPEQFRRLDWETATASAYLNDYVACQIQRYYSATI